ncbi:uncharacterized protein Ecym_4039 [Eremothecium cymbalariae DBVPG|uniref:Uncharacterized protein n=1 Tax=Eremothecium cymbalariae (strain CBS 270.75 / DBVPG 7215 / KCTC 17166 / NRRL Y-17582) TaxID=931890 RepID=G8JSW8_ERECY|nr:hypothetical protein Ecym_4039 [Eremothecium cymbalariae DBVPG\
MRCRTFFNTFVTTGCCSYRNLKRNKYLALWCTRAELERIRGMERYIVTHRRDVNTCVLYNVLPETKTSDQESQHKLWLGKTVFEELMPVDANDWVPRYILRFEDMNTSDLVFCKTQVVACMQDFERVIQRQLNGFFYLIVQAAGLDVVLELRILDAIDEQRFRDMWYRMRDEYEMMEEMSDKSNLNKSFHNTVPSGR